FALLAVGSGAGHARMEALRSVLAGQASGSSLMSFGASLINFFNRCFLGLQVAFAYSFMWCAAAGIYLLLRQDADQTEMDDVFLEEEEAVRYGLPPLSIDEAGVPGTADHESESSVTASDSGTASSASAGSASSTGSGAESNDGSGHITESPRQ